MMRIIDSNITEIIINAKSKGKKISYRFTVYIDYAMNCVYPIYIYLSGLHSNFSFVYAII